MGHTKCLIVLLVIGCATLNADTPSYHEADEASISVFSDSIIDVVRRRGLLRVGVGLFEPWIMCGADNSLIGYEIDVAKQLAEDMGVRIQFVPTDWYFIIPLLVEEHFDLIISGMGITPERSLLINFSIPYSEFGTLLLANTALVETPQSLDDLNTSEVTFGARAGTIPADVVSEHFPQATLRLFDSDSELLDSILAGEVHALAADQVKATRWLDQHSDTLYQPFDRLFKPVPEAMAIRRGDHDGLNYLNSWIEHYSSSGWLDERRTHWFETRDWEHLLANDSTECESLFAP